MVSFRDDLLGIFKRSFHFNTYIIIDIHIHYTFYK